MCLFGKIMVTGLVLVLGRTALADSGCDVVCAADDTPAAIRSRARYVCPADDARETLQKAIDEAGELGVRCVLLKGTYVINSRSMVSEKGAICFFNRNPNPGIYAHNKGCFRTLEGVVEPLGWRDGAVVVMGDRLYESLGSDETFSLFFAAGNSVFGRAWSIRNLAVRLPSNQKPVIVFDGRFCSALTYENLWVAAVDPTSFDYASAKGIPVPHPRSVGIRGSCGSNFYCRNEWKNLSVIGFGTGFDIGGEHVYCESLSALYNIYGFAFNCYRGKHSIADSDALTSGPWGCYYPITCVNLLDEHSVNMPRFGHEGWTRNQPVTILGMNVQWPNTCPGKTDRAAPDFLDGRCRATEAVPGSWRGSIEYVIDRPTPKAQTNIVPDGFFEEGHGSGVKTFNLVFDKR